jgi:hypothetical protein
MWFTALPGNTDLNLYATEWAAKLQFRGSGTSLAVDREFCNFRVYKVGGHVLNTE